MRRTVIMFDDVESQVFYYCKNHFDNRKNHIEDFRKFANVWLGFDNASNQGIFAMVSSIFKSLDVDNNEILSTVLFGNRFKPEITDPFERYINKVMEIIGFISIFDANDNKVIELKPINPNFFES